VLKLNVEVVDHAEWDEDTIRERSEALFEIARKVWPLPK